MNIEEKIKKDIEELNYQIKTLSPDNPNRELGWLIILVIKFILRKIYEK